MKTQEQPIADVVTQDVPPFIVNTDAGVHSKIGWWIVLAGVGGFLLWASLAPLDKGVPISGTVAVASNRKAIQPLNGGMVEDILVKEGDHVKAGQLLVRMNNVETKSAFEITRGQYIVSRATQARLTAERDGAKGLTFPASLASLKNDPRVNDAMRLQNQLFVSRQSSLQSELGAYDENIAGLKIQMQGLQESEEGKKQQMQFLKEQLDGMRDLSKEGYVARNRLLELERTYAQLSGAISEDLGNIGRSHRQIAELTLRKLQRTQDYQREVRTQLADTEKEGDGLANRLLSQNYELNNSLINSPVDGTVVGVNVFTRGGVVGPGFKMMDVVPKDDALVVEGQIPVNLIDKVHTGLKVDLIFSAFNQNSTPHIPGMVTQVSADRLLDEKTGAPYYKLQAVVTPEGKKLLAHLDVRPGMPVELFVHTGERTMMNYLMKPLVDRAKTSLTEE